MRYLGLLWLLTSLGAQAQTEAALKAFFEGKKVLLKLDLPTGKDGVDVYPKAKPMVDFKRYSTRLRQNGPALRRGDSATVTLVGVKEKTIEFQLSMGYGIFPQGPTLGTALLHIWYPDKSLKSAVPAPEDLLQVLSEVIDFGRGTQVSPTGSDLSARLKKGMTQGQVLDLLGAPRQSREHMEGDMKVVTHTFVSAQESIEVDFVKNLVVNYRIRAR